MKCIVFVGLLLVVSGALAEEKPASTLLADAAKNAQEQIAKFGENLKNYIPDQETFFKTVQEQTTNVVNNVQGYIANVTEEVINTLFFHFLHCHTRIIFLKTNSFYIEKIWSFK